MEKDKKISSITRHIALAVFVETAVNGAFSMLFQGFLRFFYSDYAHLTIWGDIVKIVAVIISFIIYDSFAHAAYHKRRDRLMFLGIVYVASKAASIVHYLMAIAASVFLDGFTEIPQMAVAAVTAVLEVAVDVAAAVWLMGYFDKKIQKEK